MNMLITGIVCLVIGLIIGFYVLPLFSKEKQRDDKLENKLSSMQQDFSEYQQEVANHLRDTSSLIDKVHHHYLQLQEHLFQGAKSLNRDTAKSSLFEPSQYYMHVQKSINGIKTKLVSKNNGKKSGKSKKPLKPPLDYDPNKHVPTGKGDGKSG